MNNRLLNKLVFASMKNNKRTLFPFLLASSLTAMVFFILTSLAFGPFIYYNHTEAFYGAQTIAILLEMGSQIVAIFSVIFIFYANQFVMKDRRREIGLYGVLGLSRRNIARMMILESLINAFICLAAGILAGAFLNKVMLLFLYKIVGQAPVEGLFFSMMALEKTVKVFGAAFVICCIYNICSVNVGNPIELLRSNATGEKEPKVKWAMLVIGVAALLAGYYVAMRCKSPSEAITTLFGAIVLVVIGTYFLFITGSIFVLKTLKKNKKFYYKTRNFISVSNLIYRMKHNAAGLASICILSTAVILLITCATALMTLGRQNINTMFPSDVMIIGERTLEEINAGKEAQADVDAQYKKAVDEAASACAVSVDDVWVQTLHYDMFNNSDTGFTFTTPDGWVDVDRQSMMYIFTAEEYEKLTGEQVILEFDQVLYSDTANRKFARLEVQDKSYEVVGELNLKDFQKVNQSEMTLFNNAYMVLADEAARVNLLENEPEKSEGIDVVIGFNLPEKLSEKEMTAFGDSLRSKLGFESVSFKAESEKFFVSIYGGAFFVGVFLAALFLMATVLIIYYKQMSEGFEDKKRYEILKNVGLTDKEVKATIKRQVMILFFLPVVTAIIHMLVASRIVRLFMRVILIVDAFTFNMSILAVALVFLVIYALVYKITSNEYYRIVN